MNRPNGSDIPFVDGHIRYVGMVRRGWHASPYLQMDRGVYDAETVQRTAADTDLNSAGMTRSAWLRGIRAAVESAHDKTRFAWHNSVCSDHGRLMRKPDTR